MNSIFIRLHVVMGTAVAQWLRHCATNQKVAGSIPDGVMEIFIDINPSDRTMALGSTQPLTEISTGSISWW
jgi:membrane-bound lytic murein transglycosylase B